MTRSKTTAPEFLENKLTNNTYTTLPSFMYSFERPEPVSKPEFIAINHALAKELGVDNNISSSQDSLNILSGQNIASQSTPFSMGYAGHQFGNRVPQLGDGRALVLGELEKPTGNRVDIQLKGSGRTPYSRQGDGRSPLGPVIREYLMSEAMHALGIPTTRALAAVATGDTVYRESPLPGGILTRVSESLIRIGSFEFCATFGNKQDMIDLGDYVLKRLYPHLLESKTPYLDLFLAIAERQAKLLSQWMCIGFIHGVMNTDNSSIVGETIDYGPCAFLDHYRPSTVFSYIDHAGRYAYQNQPKIMAWNLLVLGHCLVDILDPTPEKSHAMVHEVITHYWTCYEKNWLTGIGQKLGLLSTQQDDAKLIHTFLSILEKQEIDYTLAFVELRQYFLKKRAPLTVLDEQDPEISAWLDQWTQRVEKEKGGKDAAVKLMATVNPYIIARNHLIEEAIESGYKGDYAPMEHLHNALQTPYKICEEHAPFSQPARPGEWEEVTYCGT